jgi:hypothetical protein
MRILIQLFALFALSNASAQISFYKLYSGTGYDKGEGIVQLEDSSYVISGSSSSWDGSSQAFLLKLDSLGNYKWSQHYGGPESETGKRVLYNKDLGFYVAGSSNSFGAGDFDAYLFKTDLNGTKIWEKSYGKPGNWERINDAVMASDSGIVMVGETLNMNSGNSDILIIKTDKNGDTLWTKQMGGEGIDIANTIVKKGDNFLIGGEWYIEDSLVNKGFIIEIGPTGTILWQDTISHLTGHYVVTDLSIGDSKYYVAGYRLKPNGKSGAYTAAFNNDGTLFSQYTIDNAQNPNIQNKEIMFNPIANKVAIGYYTQNSGTFQDTFDLVFAYFDPNYVEWMNQFTTVLNAGVDEIGQLLPTSDGGYVAVGTNTNTGVAQYTLNGGSNLYLMKVDGNANYPNSDGEYTLNQLVGIEINTELFKGKVFPNPFKDEFTIEMEGAENTNATLLNNLGQEIASFNFQSVVTYSTSFLSGGTYFLKMGNSVTKLVKLD